MKTMDENPGLETRPHGWFALCFSTDIEPGSCIKGILATRQYRLKRQEDGTLKFWGCVQNVREQNGFILGWHHPDNQPPHWNVPALDDLDWRPFRFHHLIAKSHPQEVFENSIDIAHFPKIHHYSDISVVSPMKTEGHTMRVRYAIARAHPVPGFTKKIRAEFEVFLHGIGCAHNTIDLPIGGIQAKMLVFATPTIAGKVDIRIGVTVPKKAQNPVVQAILPLIHRGATQNIIHDFKQDCAIWNNKEFISPPVLVAADGPIGDFRRWCQQFYARPAKPHRSFNRRMA